MSPPNAAALPEPQDYDHGVALRAEAGKLIESHVSYSHAIAAEIMRKLPPDLERKDIQGWAQLGLVEAANSFDRSRGVQFKTFAYYRIKGAIYDGLRKMGWYPKGQYQQMRFEMAANEYLKDVSTDASRTASPEAQVHDLRELTANLVGCYMLSLDAMPQEPEDRNAISAEEQAVRKQQTQNLRASLAQLPETNRRVLQHCYFEGMTLEETGRKLGLSKSWVCRLHAKSLELLRKQLMLVSGLRVGNTPATFPRTVR